MAVLLYHHTGLDTIPPDCQLPIQTAHLVLSVGLLIGIIVSYIPQVHEGSQWADLHVATQNNHNKVE